MVQNSGKEPKEMERRDRKGKKRRSHQASVKKNLAQEMNEKKVNTEDRK